MEISNGKQILKGLAETRSFFGKVSLMLRTADDLMGENQWKKLDNRTCFLSGVIYNPKYWMPVNLHRYYTADENMENNKDLLVFIAVLLDRDNAWSGFDEPWITCGFFKFRPKKDPKVGWRWDDNLEESYLELKKEANGEFQLHTYSEKEEYGDRLVYEEYMALPLVEITSADELKAKIVDPLLGRISDLKTGSTFKKDV